jgi:fatty acid desaturase
MVKKQPTEKKTLLHSRKTMNTITRISTAERLGHWLGRGWRAYARGERRVAAWLVSQGMPGAGATVLLWIVKFGVLAGSLYVAFWLSLLLVALAVVAALSMGNVGWEDGDIGLTALPHTEHEPDEPEMRQGVFGYGLYDGEQRIN